MTMGWFKRLFGHGTVRVSFEGVDKDAKVVSGSAKVPYEGAYDESELLQHFKNVCLVEHNIIVTKATVVGRVEH
jgi:hypothetical protein